jgi:hypothetical protein
MPSMSGNCMGGSMREQRRPGTKVNIILASNTRKGGGSIGGREKYWQSGILKRRKLAGSCRNNVHKSMCALPRRNKFVFDSSAAQLLFNFALNLRRPPLTCFSHAWFGAFPPRLEVLLGLSAHEYPPTPNFCRFP